MKKPLAPSVPLIFVGLAILVHAAVYWQASTPDPWIYAPVGGLQTRTNKATGERFIATSTGWVTEAQWREGRSSR